MFNENAEMALSDITKIIKYSQDLQTMFNVNDNLEDWVKAKLNHACDYVATVRDYIKFYKEEKSIVENIINESLELEEKYNKEDIDKIIDGVQYALDVVGLDPTMTIGTVADASNSIISLLRAALSKEKDEVKKHLLNSAISGVSLIPFGDLAKLIKLRLLRKPAVKLLRFVKKYLKSAKPSYADALLEKWSMKYKRSIDCKNPKGFGQKAHCRARQLRKSGIKTKSKPVRESYKQAIKELLSEYDSSMAMGSLKQINNDAKEIESLLNQNDELEDWVKAKLNLAGEYLDDIYHHLDHFGPQGRKLDGVSDAMKLKEGWKDLVAAGALGLAALTGPSDVSAAANQPTKKVTAPLQLTPVTNRTSKVKEPLKLIPVTRTSSTNASIDQLQLQKDIEIVAATLIGEAGGEGEVGMQAVLNVIMNRSKNNFSNAAKVCLKPWQFSVWNDQKGNIKGYIKEKKKHPRWSVALSLINKARNGNLADITGGATFYVNPRVEDPDWRKKFKLTKTIGKHEFYHHGKHKTSRFYEYFGFNYYF